MALSDWLISITSRELLTGNLLSHVDIALRARNSLMCAVGLCRMPIAIVVLVRFARLTVNIEL